MKYIANILTDEPFSSSQLYNVVRDSSELVPDIPTLIVGWDKTKSEYPDASIIEWSVTDNVYWTYGKYERRDKFEFNVKKFQELAFKKFIESIEYVFYDVILSGPEKFESFMLSLAKDTPKTVYVTGDMMYIYYDGTHKVVGLSLRDCDYLGDGIKKKVFSAIYNNKAIKTLKNNDEISRELRFKTKSQIYILPYLYS